MYLKIDYLEIEGGVSIVRCYGYEEHLHLPDEIDGKPVTALYDYALSASRPWKEPEHVKQTILNEEEQGFGDEVVLAGEYIREVYLPKHLRNIGNYAFYFCRNLHTLHFRGNLETLGGGCFMWCRHLTNLSFSGVSHQGHGMKGVLAELTHELEITISYEDGETLHLTFPEYYEESVENTPARIIDVHWHGSGYKYRQCFQGDLLDLKRYDEQFTYAVANEFPTTCVPLAMNRLKDDIQLSEEAKVRYRTYVKEHMKDMLKEWIRKDDLESIHFLAKEELLDRETTNWAMELASQLQKAELGSFLMDYRQKHFRRVHKTFDL